MAQTPEFVSFVQVDAYLNGIKEAFERLNQELHATRIERDQYKAMLNAQVKEFDNFRHSVRLQIVTGIQQIGDTDGNDVQPEPPMSPTGTEYYSPQDEVTGNVTDGNLDSEFQQENDDNPAGPLPSAVTLTSADFNLNSDPEGDKHNGSDWYAEFNSNDKKQLDVYPVHTFAHEVDAFCVKFSADGMYLAMGGEKGEVRIYDMTTGEKICLLVDRYIQEQRNVYAVCFSPEGKYLATGGHDCNIRIWEIGKRYIRNMFKGHEATVDSLHFSPDGRVVISGSYDNTVRVWDMRTGATSRIFESSKPFWSVCFSPCGLYIAVGSFSLVMIWDVRTGAVVEYSNKHDGFLHGLTFTPDGKRLVSGSCDGTLKLWDVSSLGSAQRQGSREGEGGKKIDGLLEFVRAGYVRSIAVSCDGQWIISGAESGECRVCLWNARNAERVCLLQGHKSPVYSVDFSPRENCFATGSGGHVVLWSYQTIC